MTRGLVIGKFMPVHAGHLALIEFATRHCDELIVSVSYKENDPIGGEVRFSWLKEIFIDSKKIKPVLIKDDFDNESLPWPERTRVWARFLKRQYQNIDILVSSEDYGVLLAEVLGCRHLSFDPNRKIVPVSATRIREKPFTHWEFIPKVVRPYFVKKICFYGPESTGKSFLAQKLAVRYHTEFVPEVAREVVTSNEFTLDDIIKIGNLHVERIKEKTKTANRILFCDTDAITTQIYCRHYLGGVPDVLYELEKEIIYDQYFLFDVDVPWVSDGMRDLGERRKEMFDVFKKELETRNLPYLLVQGNYEERTNFVMEEVEKMLSH